MKKIFLGILLFMTVLFMPQAVHAQQKEGGSNTAGQCVNNKRCVLRPVPGAPAGTTVLTPQGGDCGSAQLGSVQLPSSIQYYPGSAGGVNGFMFFLSRLINFFVIICGIWTLFNFLFAGYTFISAQSDAKAMTSVRESLTMTAIGLAIIAGAYIIAGLIGLIFFGDASFILSPQITGALDLK